MSNKNLPLEPDNPQFALPMVVARNEKTVRDGFWKKLAKFVGHIPFAEDAAAAWFCSRDPKTPTRVKATLLAALAYFVMPIDVIPDFITGLGFTDDATVLMAAIGLVSTHLTPEHRKAARAALHLPPLDEETH